MTNREALCALYVAILMLTAGFVWLYGPFGLLGGGLAVAVLTLTTDKREDDDD
jgi:hypothetical protein